MQSGGVNVLSLWNENSNDINITAVSVRESAQPPLPSSTSGPAVIVRSTTLSFNHHIFAVAWTDGRICVCHVSRITSSVLNSPPYSLLPRNSSFEWGALTCLPTQYSIFRLEFIRMSSLSVCDKMNEPFEKIDQEREFNEKDNGMRANDSSDNLDNYWKSVHGDGDEEGEREIENSEKCDLSEIFLIASSHTGHTLFISLVGGETGALDEEHQISQSTERKIFSFDSRHALHSQALRASASGLQPVFLSLITRLGFLSHLSCTSSSQELTPLPLPTLSLIYLTSGGEVWIIKEVETELSRFGPPTVPLITFSLSDVEKANRIVRLWNIISPSESLQMRQERREPNEGENEHLNDGLDLIQRLLAMN